MPSHCVAIGCFNSGKVKFPTNLELLQKWKVAVNREGKVKGSLWTPSKHSRLCHEHFKPEDYRATKDAVVGFERKHLKVEAVPSLNLGTKKSILMEISDTPRSARKRKRDGQPAATATSPDDLEHDPDHHIDFFSAEYDMNIHTNPPLLHANLEWIGAVEEISFSETEARTGCVMTAPHSISGYGTKRENEKEETQTVQISTRSVGTETMKTVPRIQSQVSSDMFKNRPEALLFYTGFQDFGHFSFFFSCLEPAIYRLEYKSIKLSRMDEIFLTLMKLRCAKPDVELSIMFGIGNKAVGLVFNNMIRFLFYHLKDMTPWLPKDVVDLFTPLDFKSKYPGTRVILDGTEFFIQKPSDVKDQSATWSSYKNHATLKSMIGIAPRGIVTHVSPSYGGCTSDRQIIERSELVQKGMFEKGDSIMADRGIMVQDLFASMNVKVNTPTMLKGRSQLSSEEVIKDRRIAAKRIHVERVIGLAKKFKILATEMHHSLRPISDKIIFVCFALCNFKPCIVGKYA